MFKNETFSDIFCSANKTYSCGTDNDGTNLTNYL